MRLVGLQPAALVCLFLSTAAGCGGSRKGADGGKSAQAPDIPTPANPSSASSATLGTITATIGGRQQTWYVVAAPIRGRQQATGGWITLGDHRVIVLAGFDVERPPLESFEWGTDGTLLGYRDYTGSLLTVMVRVDGASWPGSIRFPGESGRSSSVIYLPRASTSDPGAIHSLEDGTLEVSEARIDGDEARVEGSFAGTFPSLAGGDAVRITDGRFQASGLGPLASMPAQ
jgi:hypothetical protein